MILPLLALAAAAPPPPAIVPPPIVSISGAGEEAGAAVVSFRTGRARCQGGEEPLLLNEPPLPTVTVPIGPAAPPPPVTLSFRIDSAGRPLGIAEVPRSEGSGPWFNRRDILAALAASRFRPGGERSGCTLAYEPIVEPVDRAELATLYRLVALQPPPTARVRRAVVERTAPPGSNCFDDPRLNVRLRAYPAFEEIPQAPGTLSHSFVGFDLDGQGRPRNVRLLGSGGNSELDRQSVDSVRRSRFSPIAKLGCTYSYWRRQSEPLPAPPPPPEDAHRVDQATCPKDGSPWSYMPALSFPPEFERRGIEGWAIVRFDVAPWGGVGNVRVIAAEPAAPFGQQAAQIVGAARKPPSDQGRAGCVARVLFRLGASPEAHPILGP